MNSVTFTSCEVFVLLGSLAFVSQAGVVLKTSMIQPQKLPPWLKKGEVRMTELITEDKTLNLMMAIQFKTCRHNPKQWWYSIYSRHICFDRVVITIKESHVMLMRCCYKLSVSLSCILIFLLHQLTGSGTRCPSMSALQVPRFSADQRRKSLVTQSNKRQTTKANGMNSSHWSMLLFSGSRVIVSASASLSVCI